MRTLLLVLAFIGLGYLLAKVQLNRRVAGVMNVMGAEDVDAAATKDKSQLESAVESQLAAKTGKIEVVNGTELDFGTMKKGGKRSHKFVFKNTGEGDAVLWFKASTCKCTVGKFTEATLVPGEQTDVELEWTADSPVDEFSQSATIGTNCPNQEEIRLLIRGKIGEAYVFEPPPHVYGDIYSNRTTEIPVTIYSFEEPPLELTSGSIQNAVLSKKIQVELGEERHLEPDEIPDKLGARHMVEMKIKLLPGLPAGPIKVDILLARKHEGQFEMPEFLSYDVRVKCITPVRIIAGDGYDEVRNIFTLGAAKSSQGLKKSVMLAIRNEDSPNDPNLRISKVFPSQLIATVGEPKISPTQRIYTITVEIPPGTEPVEFDGTYSKDFGKIVIETDMETSPEIPMFVKFRITE
jgi:hypothetical protein